MAVNKNQERYATIQLQMPAGIAISSGNLLLFGTGGHAMSGVVQDSQVAAGVPNPPFDSGSGFLTVDFEGVYNLSVKGQTQSSPSAGARLTPGAQVYADGGTYDPLTGVTYGSTLDGDSNGTFVGILLDTVAAGATTTVRVVLKNAPC